MINITGISKSFSKDGKEFEAVKDVSLTIGAGEFVSLIGPSGCGKSTILNMIAGLLAPDRGTVEYDGEPVTGINTAVGYMTQKDSLLPWRTTEGNISAPLDIRRVPKAERAELVARAIEKVHLEGFERHHPDELSGGMRKRVLLARTLIYEPGTLLMDEPFGALDALLKLIMQEELMRIWNEAKSTVVYVTHDLPEAISVSDRIIVFSKRPGRIVLDQRVHLDRPRDLDTIRSSSEFLELHDLLWSTLRSEVIGQDEATGDAE
jgi:NitT/TauT family transport system ATP-binding protein